MDGMLVYQGEAGSILAALSCRCRSYSALLLSCSIASFLAFSHRATKRSRFSSNSTWQRVSHVERTPGN